MEGLSQVNAVLSSSTYLVMTQLSQLTTAMGVMQTQLKTLYSSVTTVTKQKYYCWSYCGKFSHGSKSFPTKEAIHNYEAYY